MLNLHYRDRAQVLRAHALTPEVIDALICEVVKSLELDELRMQELPHCLQKHDPERIRTFIERHVNGLQVKELQADGNLRSADAIYKEHRELKKRIRDCVDKRVEQELRKQR